MRDGAEFLLHGGTKLLLRCIERRHRELVHRRPLGHWKDVLATETEAENWTSCCTGGTALPGNFRACVGTRSACSGHVNSISVRQSVSGSPRVSKIGPFKNKTFSLEVVVACMYWTVTLLTGLRLVTGFDLNMHTSICQPASLLLKITVTR
jgi:hypothetical protein